jgi:hypothetical protein
VAHAQVVRRVEAVVHRRGQPQRDVAAVGERRRVLRGAEQLVQRVGVALGLEHLAALHRPALADDGVARAGQHPGSGSKGRAPGRSSRVKHSCRLAKRCCRASLRSSSVNSRHTRSTAASARGAAGAEYQPIRRVAAMRGMRLVSRKFRSSCKNRRARGAGFIGLSIGTVRQGGFHGGDTIHMDDSLPFSSVPALWALAIGALAWTLPRARRRLQLSRAKHRSLAGHARMARRVAALIPGYAYDEASFFAAMAPPRWCRRSAAPAFTGWPRCTPALADQRRHDRRCARAVVRPAVHRPLPGAVPVQPLSAPAPEARRLRAAPKASRSRTWTATASSTSPAPMASTCSATTSTRTASPRR